MLLFSAFFSQSAIDPDHQTRKIFCDSDAFLQKLKLSCEIGKLKKLGFLQLELNKGGNGDQNQNFHLETISSDGK